MFKPRRTPEPPPEREDRDTLVDGLAGVDTLPPESVELPPCMAVTLPPDTVREKEPAGSIQSSIPG
jgi:hypothetical protein